MIKFRIHSFYIVLISFLIFFLNFNSESHAEVTVKIRDIAYIDGLKENQVFGFGLVIGLQGTGDSKSSLVESSLKSLLKNIGIVEEGDHKSNNIAAVLLTAKLAAFSRIGDRIDVIVSSIGNAKSLEGGILIQSPLRGADGRTYVVAQGALTFPTSKQSAKKIKTVATMINGGIIEQALEPDFVRNNSIALVLNSWDFTTANNIIKAVSVKYPDSKPEIVPNGKVGIRIPDNTNLAEYISSIENIEIIPSYEARVVINEKDGTIVMGGDVKISEVVVSKEGMTIRVEKTGENASAAEFRESSSVKDIVDSLNYIGASTTDIISILKAINDAGALHANLIVK
ncbi:MAG: flagellar basal body P-ring protein FlgI [Spirochaetes bacterium]|nr:flagellar basal body P-ring protein FlgI [Spirochaetota bacterium]